MTSFYDKGMHIHFGVLLFLWDIFATFFYAFGYVGIGGIQLGRILCFFFRISYFRILLLGLLYYRSTECIRGRVGINVYMVNATYDHNGLL